jgi:cation transport ATPase
LTGDNTRTAWAIAQKVCTTCSIIMLLPFAKVLREHLPN